MTDLPPPAPVDPAALASVLAGVAGAGPVLVGAGMFCPHVGYERVAAFRVRGDAPLEPLWEGEIRREALAELREHLAERTEVWAGELDFMAATPWAYAWTLAPAPFRLWEPEGLRAWIAGDRFMLRPEPGCEVRVLPLAALADVEADLSADWVVRTVRLHRKDVEAPLVVASQVDPVVQLDPTYDRINLMFEADWVGRLAGALAAAIGRPCLVHPDLR